MWEGVGVWTGGFCDRALGRPAGRTNGERGHEAEDAVKANQRSGDHAPDMGPWGTGAQSRKEDPR